MRALTLHLCHAALSGPTRADVMAAMFDEQPSLLKVLSKPRYKVVKVWYSAGYTLARCWSVRAS
jgi:hypothetical protein